MYNPGTNDPCIGLLHTVGAFWRITLVTCALAGIGLFMTQPGEPCSGEHAFTLQGDVCAIKDTFPSYAEFKRELLL